MTPEHLAAIRYGLSLTDYEEHPEAHRLLAEVDRLREGMEALVTRYRIAWDEGGDMEAHGYAEDLLKLLGEDA